MKESDDRGGGVETQERVAKAEDGGGRIEEEKGVEIGENEDDGGGGVG